MIKQHYTLEGYRIFIYCDKTEFFSNFDEWQSIIFFLKNYFTCTRKKRKEKTDKHTQNTNHNFLSVLINVIHFSYFIRLSNRVFVRNDEIFTLTVFNILRAETNTMNSV